MKIVEVFCSHCSFVVFVTCVRTLRTQHIKHLLCSERGSVWQGLIDFLSNMARFLFSLRRPVGIPLGNVVGKEIHHVLDVASHLTTSNEASPSQRRRLI